ncbi:hypothetical protein NADE_007990 [Nannochloris sp. 'desiccata']|nr:hypothetical protein NADE_007990 [Chlorella desiccata (nom. nud.)]
MFPTTQDTNPVQHCLLNVKKDGNTKTNRYGEFRGAACGRHKHAHLNAQGWLADMLIYDALTPGRDVDFEDLVLHRREEWRTMPLFHHDNVVSADGLTSLFSNQLSKAGLRNTTNRLTHLMRNTAATRAGAHSSVDIVELLGEWKSGSTRAGSYLSKSQSSTLPAHLALAGFNGPFNHYLGRAEVQVPDARVDVVLPGGVVNTTDVQKLKSTIKGRTKVSMPDLKKMLDAHWQVTTGWPAVCYGEAEKTGAK